MLKGLKQSSMHEYGTAGMTQIWVLIRHAVCLVIDDLKAYSQGTLSR